MAGWGRSPAVLLPGSVYVVTAESSQSRTPGCDRSLTQHTLVESQPNPALGQPRLNAPIQEHEAAAGRRHWRFTPCT